MRTEHFACRQCEQWVENLNVMIECLAQAVSRGKSRLLHGLGYKIRVMREDVEQILWEQITAKPFRFRRTHEMCCSFCLRCRILCVPLKEAEYGITIELVQYYG